MKKRLLSLFLALALTMGLAVPAFATPIPATAEEAFKNVTWEYTLGNGRTASGKGDGPTVNKTFDIAWYGNDLEEGTLPGYFAVRDNTEFTLRFNKSAEDDNSFIQICIAPYVYYGSDQYNGRYMWEESPRVMVLTPNGEFDYNINAVESKVIRAGETVTFKLPTIYAYLHIGSEWNVKTEMPEVIYHLEFRKFYPDTAHEVPGMHGPETAYSYLSQYADFKVDNAAVESYLAGETPSTPSIPSIPTTPTNPTEQPTTPPTNADSFPYSIPGTPDFLRLSVQPIGSYQTDVYDIGGEKEVTVYHFPVGTKLGLTAEGVNKGYTIANVSSGSLGDWDRTEYTITKGSLLEQWFMVSSPDDPEGFIVYIHPINTNTAFQDVKAGTYYENAVKWAVKYGITNGTSATSFTPEKTCSNAEILTMLYRVFDWMIVSEDNPFSDVKPSDYYYEAARWAAEYGIVSGTTFDPDKPCTRAMTVTYIWKAVDSPDVDSTASFTDVPGGADYAKAVAWAVEEGVTNGTSSTTFSPNDTCTRGQIATFLYRALG